jgi:predicted NBD/HSP70 family sugar kinase
MRRTLTDHRALLSDTILHLRSRRAVSRSSLAKALGASASTLGLYVDQLVALGLVREIGVEKISVGRPQRVLGLRSEAGWYAGLEFNAQRIQAVRVDFSGAVVATQKVDLPEDADAVQVVQRLFQALEMLNSPTSEPLLGVGVGVPGLVDRAQGMARYFTHLKNWRDVPLGDILSKRLGVHVSLENNLRVIALAERWFGQGRGLNDYIVLGPRSGLGLGIVQRGELLRGSHEQAGEIGFWTWPHVSDSSPIQDFLSAQAVYRRLAGLASTVVLPNDLQLALSKMVNPDSEAWKEVVLDFARLLRSLQLLIDPQIVFLHGPLTALGHRFCSEVSSTAGALLPQMPGLSIHFVPSTLGDDAGALGAASLAMEAWMPPI